MSSIRMEQLSSFGRLAVKLDAEFSELARLGAQIQRLDIDTESGLEHAVKLLGKFAESGKAISEGIQQFSTVLQEARERSESAAQTVSARANDIRDRKMRQADLRGKLLQIEDVVKNVNEDLSQFKRDGKSDPTDADKLQMRAELEKANAALRTLIVDAEATKESAREMKFKTLEREAQALLDTLRSSCRKVDKVLAESNRP